VPIVNTALSYIKGLCLLPLYVKRTFDFVRKSEGRSGKDALTERHRAIRQELEYSHASILGEMMTLNGIKILLDPPRVIETVQEVMLKRDYDFYGINGTFVMIDIGMNVAFATLCAANSDKFSKVYSFEPLKPTFDIALRNIALNPKLSEKIQPANIGLSDRNENLEVKYSLDEIMSISSEGTFDSCIATNTKSETIQLRKASEVIGPIVESHAGEKLFLKVDCEGAEFKIFKDLEAAGLLKAVDVVVVEWHNGDPDEIIRSLVAAGFFCFLQKSNAQWNIGMIKAVRYSGETNPQRP
jgi:FkbM family methyltransferase